MRRLKMPWGRFRSQHKHAPGNADAVEQSGTSSTSEVPAMLPQKSPTPSDPFAEAYHSFLKSLSEKDRQQFSKCTSPEALKKDIFSLQIVAKDKTRKWETRINSFINTLQPYFRVVDTLVSSNPEYAAIAWGAVKLVFQVS